MSVSHVDLARRAADLASRATGPRPESSRPDKPELAHPNPLVGELERIVVGPDRGYGSTRIAEIRAIDGAAWSLWLLGHVLQHEFDQTTEGTPRPGELVAVRFEGRRRRQNARPGEPAELQTYRVMVDRGV